MAIKANAKGGKDFELVPEGMHFAICTKVIFLGLQDATFDGVKKQQEKVFLGFEVPDITHEYEKGGKKVVGPAIIGRTFTLSIGDKSNLGPFVKNWRGKGFSEEELDEGYDLEILAGKPCQLGVTHETKNGKTYANVTSAGSLIKEVKDAIAAGTRKVEPHDGVVVYNPYEHSETAWSKVPKFLREKIENRIKPTPAAGKTGTTRQDQDFDDDIPF
jgi:hypothetical protein